MKSYNKNNLINIGIVALLLLTFFFLVAALYFVSGPGYWFLLPTIAAAVYGGYAFYTKYHIKDIYKDEK